MKKRGGARETLISERGGAHTYDVMHSSPRLSARSTPCANGLVFPRDSSHMVHNIVLLILNVSAGTCK